MPAPPAMTTARREMPSLRCSGGAEGVEGVGATGAGGAATDWRVNVLGDGGVLAHPSKAASVGRIVDASGDTDGAEGRAAGESEGVDRGVRVGAEETARLLPVGCPAGGVFVCETSS